MEGIFIACELLRRYNNGHHFDYRAPTRVRHIKNHASCAGYPDSQAIALDSKSEGHRDVTAMQQWTCVLHTHQCLLNTSSIQCSIKQE
jgi:hypothetical protein